MPANPAMPLAFSLWVVKGHVDMIPENSYPQKKMIHENFVSTTSRFMFWSVLFRPGVDDFGVQ
jgi:hypothetical protein